MNEENEKELISKKASYYFKEQTIVHIILENNRFYNGTIKYIGADFLLLNDRKLGEVCIFFIELKGIDPFVEEGK